MRTSDPGWGETGHGGNACGVGFQELWENGGAGMDSGYLKGDMRWVYDLEERTGGQEAMEASMGHGP